MHETRRPTDEVPPPVHCDACGIVLEPDQTYCLECGAPTPLAPRMRRRARRSALALTSAVIVLGLGSGALASAGLTRGEVPATNASVVEQARTAPTTAAGDATGVPASRP